MILYDCDEPPNGLRYLRVGGRGQNFESRILFGRGKCPKMPHAKRPTRQVHALLGTFEMYFYIHSSDTFINRFGEGASQIQQALKLLWNGLKSPHIHCEVTFAQSKQTHARFKDCMLCSLRQKDVCPIGGVASQLKLIIKRLAL